MMIQLSIEKYQFWLKNVSLFRKVLINKVESFLKVNFDIKQGYKILFRTFNGTDWLYIYIMIGEML